MLICSMNAEIITIGDELLIGQTVDTNSVYLAKKLEEIGIRISRKTAISDNVNDINEMLFSAMKRVQLIIITGGLGPTKDDITKKTLATFFNSGWRTDLSVIEHLENIFKNRGRELLETNKLQAELPDKCETLFNAVGTAPGMLFQEDNKIIISLPGVPNEVKYITENQLIPRLSDLFKLKAVTHKTLVTLMIAESLLSKKLENFEAQLPMDLSLAYLPNFNAVKLRLSCHNPQFSEKEFENYFQKLQHELGSHLFCLGDRNPVEYIAEKLIHQKIEIALAESCTGGYIANQFIQIAGISSIIKGSMITYSNDVKVHELLVPQNELDTEGAVSEIVALRMVEGICRKFNSNIGIATTGIAGPDGGSEKKPVGTIFIAVKYNDRQIVQKFRLFGTRVQFMERATNCAMFMVKEILEN